MCLRLRALYVAVALCLVLTLTPPGGYSPDSASSTAACAHAPATRCCLWAHRPYQAAQALITALILAGWCTGASRAGLLRRSTRLSGSLGAHASPSEPWAAGGALAALQALGVTSAGWHARRAHAPRRALAAQGTQF